MKLNMWDAIAVTCTSTELAAVLQEELNQLHRGGIVPSKTLLLAVEDPRPNIGSGGATINALFVLCEHFCVQDDLSVINFDALLNKRLLIIHAGRDYLYEPLAGIFLPLPLRYKQSVSCDFPVTNLHWSLHLLTQKIRAGSPPGVWVYSGDLVVNTTNELDVSHCSGEEVIAFSFPVDKNTALRNGVYDIDEDGYLKEILYEAPMERIAEVRRYGDGFQYPLVTGLVYFPLRIAEKLLKLYSTPPLDACTYMGVDSGTQPLNVSLFFDILASMGSLHRGKVNGELSAAVILMHQVLCNSRVQIEVVLDSRSGYLSRNAAETEALVKDLCLHATLPAFEFCEISPWGRSGLTAAEEKFLSALEAKKLKAWRRRAPQLPDDVMWCLQSLEKGEDYIGSETMSEFCSRTGVTSDDLWEENTRRIFRTARLYPVCQSAQAMSILSDLLLVQSVDEASIAEWRKMQRISLSDMRIDTEREYHNRRHFALLAAQQKMEAVLCAPTIESRHLPSLRPVMVWAVATHSTEHLLRFLDSLTCRMSDRPGLVARIFAALADLLGTRACKRGGLRSGPASNCHWENAFAALHEGQIESGVRLLSVERERWMNTPAHMIRAARHYERAAQILISKAVQSAKTNIQAQRMGGERKLRMVKVECPARIDLSGGWSDTPPLCYENGGAVVNLSLRINDELPIGARVERTDEAVFRIFINEQEIVIRTPEDLSDYDNPVSSGALVKATLVFAGITDPSQYGLRILTWSNLPHGSGLGTSSILAAALLTALWTLDGWHFNMTDVTNGVLIVEQLMTTGGGWQDQVGGIGLGFHYGWSPPQLPLSVHFEKIPVKASIIEEINSRIILVYSGKTRLAKNLLQDVIRNWYSRDDVLSQNVKDLVTNGKRCRDALLEGDVEEFCRCVERYRIQKRIMAPGSETIYIRQLFDRLDSILSGKCMAGAGGGGFVCGFLRVGATLEELCQAMKELQEHSAEAVLYSCAIHEDGMKITTEP